MKLKSFRIRKFKNIIDSGTVDVGNLTVLVGKNEAGKTSLLRALHKFNPFEPEPYSMEREWPRGHRRERSDAQVVCEARFELDDKELEDLRAISDGAITNREVTVSKDYGGRFEVTFPDGPFPDKVHPNEIDAACSNLPLPEEAVGAAFIKVANRCRDEAIRLAHEGRFTELGTLAQTHTEALRSAMTEGNAQPQHNHENNFIKAYARELTNIGQRLSEAPSMQKEAHEYVVKRLPTFIYMDEYRAFRGTALLDQVKQRVDAKKATEDDKSLLMIMKLAELNLDEEVKKANAQDREQRQYDLDDAGASLTKEIENRWRQRRYTVQFRADGHQFFTMVEDETRSGLIRLEERSKGFQWFFSFDLMFMHESQGTFEGCVLLLDEPGLHLHPDAQRDLLLRLEAYAEKNTLIYSTHLPFMLDLRHPERIKVISETKDGAVVTDDLSSSQPEAKLTLQAALGMSGRTSYLVAQRNLVVEGVDDFWIVTALSNLLIRSGKEGLPDDVHVTAAGGAPEAAYIAALMIGQQLDVVVLLDSDVAGEQAAEKLIKNWLTRYKSATASVLMIGEAVKSGRKSFAIEDIFSDNFYLDVVQKVYGKQLAAAGIQQLNAPGDDMIVKRVDRAFEAAGLRFNKGSVAKRIRSMLTQMKTADDLPKETLERAETLLAAIRAGLPSAPS